jgi:hypothetical protein
MRSAATAMESISMQTHLDFIKRNQICPILANNDWDYLDLAQPEKLFQSCVQEVMGWYGRRGSTLSPTVLYTVLEQIILKTGLNPSETDVIDSVKHFTQSGFYKRIDQPLINTPVQLKIENNVIKYDIPILAEADGSHYAMIFDGTITNAEELSRSLEARYIALWGFYILNSYINIYNVIKDGSKSKLIAVKATADYVKESKKTILNMEYLSYNNNHPAHHLVCRSCSRREECPIITMKERTKAK